MVLFVPDHTSVNPNKEKQTEKRESPHDMLDGRPRVLDSGAGVGAPQSFEDGHEEATTGGPGYVTSTCSIDSYGLDTMLQ